MSAPTPRPPRRDARGAGGPVILVLLTSTIVGFLCHQPTIGFLIGLALGFAITLVLWRGDRG